MYFENDHLGSIRTVLNTAGTVLERNDYYPFGMRHANASHVVTANNRYKFNGKEDQTVGAIGLLDYGARMYDAQIGRWLGVDPLADSYYSISPYAYCANNPVRFIDPNGMFYDDYISSFNGKFLGSDNFPSKRIFMIDDEKFHEINKENGITIYDKAVEWKKNGREVVIEELAIRAAAQDVGDNSMTTGLEHQIYISFDRNSGKVSFVDGGAGIHDQVDLNSTLWACLINLVENGSA